MPAGVYPTQTKDALVAGSGRNQLVVKKSLPDDLVYALTKAIFEHLPEIQTVHVAFKIITPQSALDSKLIMIPVHPGAIKYVTEKGFWSDADVKRNNEILAAVQSKLK